MRKDSKGVQGYGRMENWGHRPDCGPLGWERKSVWVHIPAYTHVEGSCGGRGSLSCVPSELYPVTESFRVFQEGGG